MDFVTDDTNSREVEAISVVFFFRFQESDNSISWV